MRFSIGAILMFTVPDTIIRSECRGDAHGTMPRRSTSKRDAKVALISIAQHARPNVTGQTDDFRAQLRNASAAVVTTNPPGKLWIPSVMLRKAEECLSPSGLTWWSCSHSWRSLKFLQTGTGISGTGGFTATRGSVPDRHRASRATGLPGSQPSCRCPTYGDAPRPPPPGSVI